MSIDEKMKTSTWDKLSEDEKLAVHALMTTLGAQAAEVFSPDILRGALEEQSNESR